MPTAAPPAALPWRLLAAVYDALPVLALWLLVSAIVMLLHGNRPFAPLSLGQIALWVLCWLVTGLYATASWRRGGQTLGMRPWRLRVLGTDTGTIASWRALWIRYAIAWISLLALGLGFLWSLIDPQRRTWHDIASRTSLVRETRR